LAISAASTLLMSPRVAAATPLRILMVGSSHTWGIKKPLRHVFASYGIPATVDVIAPIHGSLAKNRKEALAAIKDGPDDEVVGDRYDWVILQENGGLQDQISWSASVAIRNAAVEKGGDAIFYMTFPSERDFATGAYSIVLDHLIDGPCATPQCPPVGLPPACCRGYATLAHTTQLNMRVAPVGQTIVDFQADPAHAVDEIYGPDGHHLNAKGKYIAALTIFATIQRTLPDSLWEPLSLLGSGRDYKRIAREAVFGPPSGMAHTWNLAADN
jgi:hypothetical protein